MAETPTTGKHNVDNLFRPIEQGVVEKFDALFTAREKTLKRKVADLVKNKQEFLTQTFPTLITMGAEHPQLSGGVLYMMGLLSEHTPNGSEAINSIARRFAERKNTKTNENILTPALKEIHAMNERAQDKPVDRISGKEFIDRIKSQSPIYKNISPEKGHELSGVVNTELARARLTRELYNFRQCPVNVTYEKQGKTIDLGNNSSEVSILNGDSKTGKSMVFICSSAGNPTGAESFAVEYALRTGNKVYILGQPDGASGHMSQEFADAAVSDANPPVFDIFRRFRAPSYEPHTQFMKHVINTLLPANESFDLYSHSGGGIMAKNLLHDPDISNRVNNAVFLNPAGVTTEFTILPQLFRRLVPLRMLFTLLRDLPHYFRSTFELDRNEPKHTPEFWYRDRVTVAIQNGTHYRQPGWDSMQVNGGRIVLYTGGKDYAVGGKRFAKYMESRLLDTTNPPPSSVVLDYDKNGHHVTPFTHPEEVLDRIMKKLVASSAQTASS